MFWKETEVRITYPRCLQPTCFSISASLGKILPSLERSSEPHAQDTGAPGTSSPAWFPLTASSPFQKRNKVLIDTSSPVFIQRR